MGSLREIMTRGPFWYVKEGINFEVERWRWRCLCPWKDILTSRPPIDESCRIIIVLESFQFIWSVDRVKTAAVILDDGCHIFHLNPGHWSTSRTNRRAALSDISWGIKSWADVSWRRGDKATPLPPPPPCAGLCFCHRHMWTRRRTLYAALRTWSPLFCSDAVYQTHTWFTINSCVL